MRVHHLNCISTCPVGGWLMDGRTKSIVRRGELVCHCLLVETDAGLVLVDTGFGLRDVAEPAKRLSLVLWSFLAPELREEMTAIRQIEGLGFGASDVRHIVLTHLDFDHAGGLDDFPEAKVHLLGREREAALARRTLLDRMRYRPQQWSTQARWRDYDVGGDRWFGFERVRTLDGVPDDIAMIPLHGHTLGHAGVAVRRDEGWLLLAGDAYFHHGEVERVPYCPAGLQAYQRVMEKDRTARLDNQRRLRSLVRTHGDEVTVCCAHDAAELERLTGRSSRAPIGAVPRTRVAGGLSLVR
jgi:glyoxylase-like metal-dependent hydrolase (beta-lactamase superfamily II)